MPFVNGKRAVQIAAKKQMWGATEKAVLFQIETTSVWIPRRFFDFKEEKQTLEEGSGKGQLLIEEWFYKKYIEQKLQQNL